jgi:hypothetical protein
MSIIRARRPRQNFTVVENHIINDRRLGWAARGLLVYLLSKPDDWKVSVPALVSETGDAFARTGRDGIYSLLKELGDAGYARHQKSYGSDGKFVGCDWLIGEGVSEPLPANPTPRTAEPDAAEPDTAKPDALLRTDSLPRTERDKGIPSGSVGHASDPTPSASQAATADDLIATWNLHCGAVKKITRPTPARRLLILRRFKSEFDNDHAEWERFCKRVAQAPFLAGENDRGWRLPSIEWLLRPEKIENLWANVYGGEPKAASRPTYTADFNPHGLPTSDPRWRPSPGTI